MMKKNPKLILYLMILILFAGIIYIGTVGKKSEGILKGLDPKSYDIATTCTGMKDHFLTCNEGNDMYLYLNGTDIYLQKSQITIEENGDEKIATSYKEYSEKAMRERIKKEGKISVNLWTTSTGKVESIVVHEEEIRNSNKSLGSLDGLDPKTATAENIVLAADAETITLAPANYSKENEAKLQEFVKTYPMDEKLRVYRVQISDPKKKGVTRNIKYSKYSKEELLQNLSEKPRVCVWLDKDGRITALMAVEKEK